MKINSPNMKGRRVANSGLKVRGPLATPWEKMSLPIMVLRKRMTRMTGVYQPPLSAMLPVMLRPATGRLTHQWHNRGCGGAVVRWRPAVAVVSAGVGSAGHYTGTNNRTPTSVIKVNIPLPPLTTSGRDNKLNANKQTCEYIAWIVLFRCISRLLSHFGTFNFTFFCVLEHLPYYPLPRKR